VLGADEPVVVSALDEKPKRVADEHLARVRNIERNPEVCFVVDRYEEDWSQLAFVQVRGRATLLPAGSEGHSEAVAALRVKYPQYEAMAIERRALIVIDRLRGTSWRGDGTSFG
jgi:PPOX class probable F420-dependent enzyme